MKQWSSLTAVALCCAFLIGCTPVERTAYNLVVGSNAFLKTVRANHPECSTTLTQTTVCIDLWKAVGAKDLLIDVGEAYCNEASFQLTDTTPCAPSPKGTAAYTQATNALRAAISGYEQAEKDLKAVVK